MLGTIKKIPAEQLRVGMFVHDLNCGWMAHPFLTSQFKVEDPDTVMRILAAGRCEPLVDGIFNSIFRNPDALLQPVVKAIFHIGKNYYLTPKLVDLAKSADKIVSNESYEKWGIDQARWM